MEAGYHFKNGKSPKNRIIRKTFSRVFTAILLTMCSLTYVVAQNGKQTWNMTETMTATFDNGILKIATTKSAEAMPNYNRITGYPWFIVREVISEVIIDKGVTSIGDFAFYACVALASVDIPESVTSIGDEAFSECNSLTSVTIPESVTSIGDDAFFDCNSLTAVIIPGSVSYLGETVFAECKGLTSVTILDGITAINVGAFAGCINLTALIIPESVTSIGYRAFIRCSSLTSLTIPKSVLSISEGAFYYCSSLISICCHSQTPPDLLDNAVFYDVDKNKCTLYVPTDAKAAYASSDWQEWFANIVETEGIEIAGEDGKDKFTLSFTIPTNLLFFRFVCIEIACRSVVRYDSYPFVG